eukprot:CAMPEP_0172298934 /NCGR_PEP_ID=MMETSP1058-20130122/1355_1 /TAXON_ID=83371 /ORGANISM="Detonula confervacea, Strain CCMP 353" /LENGTH=542 /DNA_ID=CAMNT_0013008229 /DNA_START=109 /DNA_END=1737 /DNA_ORIENTATION=-
MVPYGDRILEHQVTSILTSDASSDGHSPATRSFAGSQDADVRVIDEEFVDQQLFFVTSYSDFDKLAHGPRGHTAKHTLRVYRFFTDGSLVLLHMAGEGSNVINPAFSRFHPRLNVVYTCTENIEENGQILAYEIHGDGSLTEIGHVDAGGLSTCYLTIDREQRHLIAVNYWDSSLVVIPLCKETGEFMGPVQSIYDPRQGKAMLAAAKSHGGVNHSMNDESTIAQRQVDPHSHALVLDPFEGCVAYVPDLGKDLIREFWYNKKEGKIGCEFNVLPSGMSTGKPDGPRYFAFHPKFNVGYVVNELSSTVAVFSIDRELLSEISHAASLGLPMDKFKGRSTLKLIQSIKTVPSAFPTTLNTCGRICVHNSGRFVIVSNRGHESIAIFRVKQGCGSRGKAMRGTLAQVGFFHTRGETPRHFQFDHSGQFLIVANQDSDTIAVFSFSLTSGEIKYTGNEYHVPSPNFICCCPMVDRYSDDDDDNQAYEKVGYTFPAIEDNVSSSVPTTVVFDPTKKKLDSQSELELARQEIAELKKQLSQISEREA